ncbi:acylphosphatase [Corynebacterium renale]|uniref:acylphosphatase n=1 Tax=Corynebacterium renale TaxID=1724 RepID=A0A2A9DPG6_9CORY|nr:acylphosphatase [Corynebacterium renale]PFG28473.1 acylphosphatase [Corynebacterium renale]SQG64931.1 acylphosphatase [Corynebacterium renale]SQI26347.1 acylphosphatase [Corynebacterium renale]STC96765.1 acylphosphatase [Corynebacterium renale]
MTRLVAHVLGHVQGVGFRWWTRSQAKELGLAGSAKNLADGRVCVVAEGPEDTCRELLQRLREEPSTHRRPGTVDLVVEQWLEPRGEVGFVEG